MPYVECCSRKPSILATLSPKIRWSLLELEERTLEGQEFLARDPPSSFLTRSL